ncbi:GFA family protein [Paraburkholderia sediminicola]
MCQTCRKAHAAHHNTAARVKREHFRVTDGAEMLSHFESSPGKFRHFCRRCGTHVYAERSELPFVVLRAATLDSDPGLKPSTRVWTSHEVPWLQSHPDILTFPEGAPS